ncbi:MAG: sulfotransferase [Acidobacteria bacterium]|nr:sulfotransferase [Acidobacteriota bacterium]
MPRNKRAVFFHSGTMAPPTTWLRLLWENGGASPAYWGRVARILVPTTLAAPLRLMERLRYGRAVKRTRIDKPPVFVIGVARSGTTHLHNLLAQDPQYGSVSTFHAAVPTFFLLGRRRLKPFMARFAPGTRPMDDVKVSMDMPQEEDVAVANTCPFSSVYAMSFPRRSQWYFERYAFMRGLSARETKRWERVYMEVLRKATLDGGGRRLVLKSPVNTGRIPHLLRLFPEARFVHIVRNPYVLYASLVHLFRSIVPLHQLHSVADDVLEDLAAFLLRETFRQYLRHRASIPEGRLAEVRFEDLERDPLGELEAVYKALNLPGWARGKVEIEKYVTGLAGYRKNRYVFEPSAIERVRRECRFALDAWGYSLP